MPNPKAFFYGGGLLLGGALVITLLLSYLSTERPLAKADTEEEVDHHDAHQHADHEEDLLKLTREQIEQMKLEFHQASPGDLLRSLSTRGKIILHPDGLAHIIPKVPGVALEARKNIGNAVKVNEVMALLESRDMADIKAAYLAALSKERLAASALKREDKLYQEKVSSEQDYLNAKSMREEALINVQLSKQKLEAFGLSEEEVDYLAGQKDPDLRLYQIRSPIDGVVIMRHLTKGEFVDNTTPIYEVADLKTVWVEIGIYPKDLHSIKEGQMVEVIASDSHASSKARLIYVSPLVADETITAKAVAELDNPEGMWRPGVFVKVDIATEKIPLPLVIPQEAVQNSEDKDFVFVVTPQGIRRTFVKLGQADSVNVEILSGLNPGEQYVANKTFLLKAELGKSSAEHEH